MPVQQNDNYSKVFFYSNVSRTWWRTLMTANMLEKLMLVMMRKSAPFRFCMASWLYSCRRYTRPRITPITWGKKSRNGHTKDGAVSKQWNQNKPEVLMCCGGQDVGEFVHKTEAVVSRMQAQSNELFHWDVFNKNSLEYTQIACPDWLSVIYGWPVAPSDWQSHCSDDYRYCLHEWLDQSVTV